MNGKFERAERTKSPEWLSVFTLQLIGAVLIALALRRIFFLLYPQFLRKGKSEPLFFQGILLDCLQRYAEILLRSSALWSIFRF